MPLVKNGAPTEDLFTAIADDAALPDGPVLVSAERFLKEADTLVARNGEIGVLWPNARDVAELKPYLSRLSVVALNFPSSATAAPTARRACCASVTASRASCGRWATCCVTRR